MGCLPIANARTWLVPVIVYLAASGIGHLAWEALHVRLYPLWGEGTLVQIRDAVLHCTRGDVILAAGVLAVPWLIGATRPYAPGQLLRVAPVAIGLGLAMTVALEWLHVSVLRNWAYSSGMPLLPGTRIGLSPIVQWVVVPALAFTATALFARSCATGWRERLREVG